MIAKLQKRFVRIAMLSVLLVVLLLSVIVDVTSLVFTNSRLNEVLSFIAENQGASLSSSGEIIRRESALSVGRMTR